MSVTEVDDLRSEAYLDRLTRTGTSAGLAGAVLYLVWSTLPIPGTANVLFHVAFGPLVVAGFVGIGAALWRGGPSVLATLGTVYGALAGAAFASMTIVQMSNLDYIRRYIREVTDPATADAFRRIFRGVFTVQLGLDLVWDVFVTLGAIFFALAMLRRSRVSTVFGATGIAVGGLTLVLNLATLPVPPAEAGLFDAGPLTGGWFLLVSVWILFFRRARRQGGGRTQAVRRHPDRRRDEPRGAPAVTPRRESVFLATRRNVRRLRAGRLMAANRRASARIFVVASLLTTAIAVSSCQDRTPEAEAGGRWTGAVDTVADGRVTISSTGGGAWTEDTVLAEPVATIGGIGITDGTEETTFGLVTGLAVDGSGRVYVADGQASAVRAFSGRGEQLGLVAGRGEGPGEVQMPQLLAAGPEGTLAVADTRGLTLLRPPAQGALPTEPAGRWTHPSFPQPYRPLRVDCRGTVYYPHKASSRGLGGAVNYYFRIDSDGSLRDTVRIPQTEGLPPGTPFVRTGPGGGRMVPGVDVPPLGPVPSWDVTPDGAVVTGQGRSYELAVIGPGGDTLRAVRRSAGRRPIPQAVRAESAAALRTRLDTLGFPASRIENLPEDVAELRLPERYPAYMDVRAGSDGRIWVERPPLPDRPDVTPYDAFDVAGVYLGTVNVPVRFAPGRGFADSRMLARPQFTRDRVYAVVVNPATGVQRVAGFRFEIPEREDSAPPEPPPPCQDASR